MFCNLKSNIVPDAEVNIEDLSIISIERRGDETYIELINNTREYLAIECTVDQHNGFVQRFRKKIQRNKSKDIN